MLSLFKASEVRLGTRNNTGNGNTKGHMTKGEKVREKHGKHHANGHVHSTRKTRETSHKTRQRCIHTKYIHAHAHTHIHTHTNTRKRHTFTEFYSALGTFNTLSRTISDTRTYFVKFAAVTIVAQRQRAQHDKSSHFRQPPDLQGSGLLNLSPDRQNELSGVLRYFTKFSVRQAAGSERFQDCLVSPSTLGQCTPHVVADMQDTPRACAVCCHMRCIVDTGVRHRLSV